MSKMDHCSDDLNQLLDPKLDPNLKAHLSNINLTPLSRIPSSRLQCTALPNVALIELVPSPVFAAKYQPLYESLFHGGERERSALIVDRLAQDSAGHRKGLAPYRLLGFQNHDGVAIAAAHFSVLIVPVNPAGRRGAVVGTDDDGNSIAGSADPGVGGPARHAIPYLQYIYVHPSHRRQDLSELLHALILGVTIADARNLGLATTGGDPAAAAAAVAAPVADLARLVPFTLFETEPPSHSGAASLARTQIHARGGGVAMMLRSRGEGRRVVSAHVQPGLEAWEPPITLVWVLRPNPGNGRGNGGGWEDEGEGLLRGLGAEVVRAYYRSMRDEGFPEKNIRVSEGMMERRVRGREFMVMALGAVTGEMYRDID